MPFILLYDIIIYISVFFFLIENEVIIYFVSADSTSNIKGRVIPIPVRETDALAKQ